MGMKKTDGAAIKVALALFSEEDGQASLTSLLQKIAALHLRTGVLTKSFSKPKEKVVFIKKLCLRIYNK